MPNPPRTNLVGIHSGTEPEGMAADELGNVFGGLTGGCNTSASGGCLQKFVKK